ncbi:D123-domain-containing protein [Scenedesmus sp. NREL 46B-D3]|nr:D123-domain-containing protein [Scenedesmus sp. NREL 46B-D3]
MHDLEQLQQMHSTQRQQQQQQAHCQQQDLQEQPQQQGHAISQPAAAAAALIKPQLVLRRWHELLPECEFRCFAAGHALVGISQRDPSQHFPQLGLPGQVARIRQQLVAWHAEKIGSSFPIDSYAMDVYVAAAGGPVWLLDFSPICSTTSPLLFSWDELPYAHMRTPTAQQDSAGSTAHGSSQEHQEPQLQQQQQHAGAVQAAAGGFGRRIDMRVVQHAGMILPGVRAATGMPIDMLGLQDSFEEVMRTMQQQQQ